MWRRLRRTRGTIGRAKLAHSLSLVLVLTLSGCWVGDLESLNPFWSEDTLVQEPALVGTWIAEEKPEGPNLILRFEEAGRGYLVSVFITGADKNGSEGFAAQFEGRLIRLGGSLFLDMCLKKFSFTGNLASEEVLFEPTHTLHRIRLKGDALGLAPVDDRWLKRKLKEEKLPRGFLRTASTKELQAFVAKLAPQMEPLDGMQFRRQM